VESQKTAEANQRMAQANQNMALNFASSTVSGLSDLGDFILGQEDIQEKLEPLFKKVDTVQNIVLNLLLFGSAHEFERFGGESVVCSIRERAKYILFSHFPDEPRYVTMMRFDPHPITGFEVEVSHLASLTLPTDHHRTTLGEKKAKFGFPKETKRRRD
jgi:hypothetical protein